MADSNVGDLPDRPDAVSEEMISAAQRAISGSFDVIAEGEEPFVGWSSVLAERALQAARQEDPLVGEVERLTDLLRDCDDLLRRHTTTWIALSDKLDDPYPDDPRWTPYSRFARPVLARTEKLRGRIRAALEGGETGG